MRTNWLRLRQAILAAPTKPKVHLGIMVASNSAFCTLFRHALIALGSRNLPVKGRPSRLSPRLPALIHRRLRRS